MAESDIQRFTYTFDTNGNRIGTVDLNGSVTTFTLDAKDRLTLDQTTGTDSHVFTYTWDSRDNLLTHTEAGTPTTMVYDAASRIQTSAKGAAVTTMTYDPNGNRIGAVTGASPWFTLTYDRENRLIEQTEDGAIIAEFGYGPFGHKRTERLARNTFDLLWDGDSYLGVRDNDISADLTKLFLSADGAIFAEQNTPWDKTGRVDWFVDFLGSVVATQAYGSPISDGRRYTPFGDLLSGDTLPPGSFGWVGNVGYRHTGLPQATSYMLHRHYDPASGQWISRDMLWPEERAYGYVNGNPVMWVDPSGLKIYFDKRMSAEERAWFNQIMRNVHLDDLDVLVQCLDNNCPTESWFKRDRVSELLSLLRQENNTPKVVIQYSYDCTPGECGFTERGGWLDTGTWYVHMCIRTKKPLGLDPKCGPPKCTLIHELLHVLGLRHPEDNEALRCVNLVSGCEKMPKTGPGWKETR